jgi:DNA-binding FadR family transcriptional regulator
VFVPVQHNRAFESVVSQIEGAIHSGEYKTGDYLPSERALSEEFAVGRSTVREALRILESMGLIATSPGSRKGAKVSASMQKGLTRMIDGAIKVEEIPLVDLIQYRMITGAAVNHLAARLRTDAQLQAMQHAIDDMKKSSRDDTAEFARADTEFHRIIREAAGNSVIEMVNAAINGAIVSLMHAAIDQSTNTEATRATFIDVHEQILAAIRQRDSGEAARLAHQSLLEAYGPSLSAEDRRLIDLMGE